MSEKSVYRMLCIETLVCSGSCRGLFGFFRRVCVFERRRYGFEFDDDDDAMMICCLTSLLKSRFKTDLSVQYISYTLPSTCLCSQLSSLDGELSVMDDELLAVDEDDEDDDDDLLALANSSVARALG